MYITTYGVVYIRARQAASREICVKREKATMETMNGRV